MADKSRKKEFLRDGFWSSPLPLLETTTALFTLRYPYKKEGETKLI
jgi:hypothetical protein